MTTTTNDYFWQGEKIRLRPMRQEDAAVWQADDTDSEGIRFLSYGIELPKSDKAAEEFGEKYADFGHRDERIMFSIETLDGDLVGGINLNGIDQKNGTFSIGSRIYRAFRGQGYGTEAKIILLRYAFHELRLHKYNIRCLETNEAMIRHAERIGCQAEGRIRQSVYTNGRYYDELLFGLTSEEFDKLHHA
ncbi:MAG: GNAT family N-acetyltransferase [Ardenticatenaceae bacterium]|nr:GNAT family N-acetyltransferase [Ardenticatenaceae bacterium]MCB8988318.1 GNAT family N-acetyltransferase [Ardenticatenaceae bacterium]